MHFTSAWLWFSVKGACLFLVCLFALYVLIIALKIVRSMVKYNVEKGHYNKQKESLVRYPGTAPFFDMFRENSWKELLHQSVDAEGNLRTSAHFLGPHMDGTPTCFISEADAFQILLTESKCPKLPSIYDSLRHLLGDGLVVSSGELWKKQRKLLTPLFHMSKLKQMPSIINQRVKQMCQEIETHIDQEHLLTSLFSELTLKIVIDCVFGGERYLEAEKMAPLWHSANIALNDFILGELVLGPFLNGITPLPTNLSFKKAMRKIRVMVSTAIEKKEKELEEEDSDLLSSLLRVEDELTGEKISHQLILDESLTFLFAGHDTTSALLSWCMLMLCNNPEVIKKIREEVERVVGDKDSSVPSFEHLRHLPYCDMVLRETLRMRPPVPTLDRHFAEDTEIHGVKYLKGTCVYPNFLASHYDKRYWKDPFKFRPERWERGEDEPTPHPFAFCPFSQGARNCIGKRFAMMEGTLALAVIINRFDISTQIKDEDVVWGFEGTMKPMNFKMRFHNR